MAEPIIWPGAAGRIWVNTSGRVAWSYACSFVNTCGWCLQFHGAISFEPWPIPWHENCSCGQQVLSPGEASDPAVDLAVVLAGLPFDQQVNVLGRSVMALIRGRVVKWEDVVSQGQVRTLSEVVSAMGLTAGRLVAAGLGRSTAERAISDAARLTPESFARARRRLEEAARQAMASAAPLRRAMAAGVSGRLVALPAGSEAAAPPAAPPSTGLLPGGPQSEATARDMAEFLARWPDVPASWLVLVLIDEMERERRRKSTP